MDRRRAALLRRQRRIRRRVATTASIAAAAALLVLDVSGFGVTASHSPPPTTTHHKTELRARRARRVPARPPQFIVTSFDGSGGARLWTYWRSVARRAHAHFTFFVSGVYLLDEARAALYHAPHHEAGRSDIGFAQPDGDDSARDVVRGTLHQIALAYHEGHEIGTHYNGHFCAPYSGSVGEWSARDWARELGAFDRLLFHASENNGLRPAVRLPFRSSEVIGGRTPCLEGNLRVLYPVLAAHGFRYDASHVAPLGTWPRRERGIWSVPLLEIPFVGHTYDVISMDYNFFANQSGAVSAPPSEARRLEDETYVSFRHAFWTTYKGNRAPLSLANHFETWNHWAYDHALARFLVATCGVPGVRCVSFRELVDWLDAHRINRR